MDEKKIYTAPEMELIARLDVLCESGSDGIIITPPHKW